MIATPRGSVPELVRHGENGFLVGNADEALAALPRIATLDRAAIRADAAARFGQERMVDDYLRVYGEILDSRPPTTDD